MPAEHLHDLPCLLEGWRKMVVAVFKLSFSSVKRLTKPLNSPTRGILSVARVRAFEERDRTGQEMSLPVGKHRRGELRLTETGASAGNTLCCFSTGRGV